MIVSESLTACSLGSSGGGGGATGSALKGFREIRSSKVVGNWSWFELGWVESTDRDFDL